MAALIISEPDDLYADVRAVLVKAVRERLKTISSLPEAGEGSEVGTWAALRDDPPMVRLLGGLWLHGWDDVLTQLWVGRPAQQYVNEKHPEKYWRNFRTYSKSEDVICWLLEKAEFGQSLIPLFQEAAQHLAEVEREAIEEAPTEADIATVMEPLFSRWAESPDTAGLLPVSTLRHILSNADHPLTRWTCDQLARHELGTSAAPSTLVRFLTDEGTNIGVAVALTLLTVDLSALLVPALVEAAQSPDDRIRMRGQQSLDIVCHSKLSNGGSTNAVEDLHNLYQFYLARGKGRERTLLANAISWLDYKALYWPARWLDLVNHGSDEEQKFARGCLKQIKRASSEVIKLLCEHLIDTDWPDQVRYSAMRALMEIRRYRTTGARRIISIGDALSVALCDSDSSIRRGAAYALQWTEGQGAWDVAEALLQAAQNDTDSETRIWALRSLGRALHAVRGFRDVDVSKEALFRWLIDKCPYWMAGMVTEMWEQLSLKETDDAHIALRGLSHFDNLGLSEEVATRLRDGEEWSKLLKDTQAEWDIRRYEIETLPYLQAAIAEVETFLTASDPATRRAAACALARLYQGDDAGPAHLRELLPDDTALLWALLDAATDRDTWDDEGSDSPSHHPASVKRIADWVEAQPPDERARLIDVMLNELAHQVAEMEHKAEDKHDNAEDEADFAEDWPIRRILIAVLAELSERLTHRAFIRSRDLAEVVDIFARAARDPDSYSARRFAIRALGNLQQLTADVADIFFEACQDTSSVHRETRTAVTKFKVFGPRSLERLAQAVSSESITVAYHAALLLGGLGVSRSEELGREGRQRVAHELYRILQDPLSERIVYDFVKSSDGERVGSLYDVVYEALLQVVSGEALEEGASEETS